MKVEKVEVKPKKSYMIPGQKEIVKLILILKQNILFLRKKIILIQNII